MNRVYFMSKVAEDFRCRIYDGTRKPTKAEVRAMRERAARPLPPRPWRGFLTLTGGGRCVCGGCLFEWRCPAPPVITEKP